MRLRFQGSRCYACVRACRRIDPLKAAVLTIGSIQGGLTFNVISEVCTLKGTIRTFDEAARKQMHCHLERVLASTCHMHEAGFELNYKWGYPPLVNHANEVNRFNRIAGGIFGTNNAGPCHPVMAAEDFAYYLQHLPGCFMFVGAGNDSQGITAPHHHPNFDIDEKAMLYAGRLLKNEFFLTCMFPLMPGRLCLCRHIFGMKGALCIENR